MHMIFCMALLLCKVVIHAGYLWLVNKPYSVSGEHDDYHNYRNQLGVLGVTSRVASLVNKYVHVWILCDVISRWNYKLLNP